MLTVNLEKRGDYYMAWHQDARDIRDVLGDVVLMKSGGADTIGIPAHALDEHVVALNQAGVTVKINRPIPGMAT